MIQFLPNMTINGRNCCEFDKVYGFRNGYGFVLTDFLIAQIKIISKEADFASNFVVIFDEIVNAFHVNFSVIASLRVEGKIEFQMQFF